MMDYHWPGNVRELENVLERSYLFASGAQLDAVELNAALPHAVDTKVNSQASPDTVCWKDAGKAAWLQHEKEAIESALARLNGNVSRVADALGYSRRAVYLKLRTHAIDPKVYRQ